MTENKIIEQIRQLLRIASDRGASINERELAQRRAERLMVRYRIESLPEGDARQGRGHYFDGGGDQGRLRVDGAGHRGRPRHPRPRPGLLLCSWRTYKRHTLATIVGTRSDLAYVTEFYNSAIMSYPSMLKDRLRYEDFYSESERRRFRRPYVMSFFRGIAERIEITTREETTSTGQDLVLASRYQRAEAKARDGVNIRPARGLLIDRDGEASGERDGYVSGIGWMGERLDGPRVGIAAS